jgi:hypothetical protein
MIWFTAQIERSSMNSLQGIKVLPWMVVLAFCWAASPTLAESPTIADPCALPPLHTKASAPGSAVLLRLERNTGVFIGKHVQRACRLIGDILRDPTVQGNKKFEVELRVTLVALREEVLAPIYREYRDLRSRDLSSAQPAPPRTPDRSDVEAHPSNRRSASKQMGPATAVYLRRTLSRMTTRLARIFGKLSCDGAGSRNECSIAQDIVAEIGFAGSPIYSSYPRLWRLALKEGMDRASAQPRTARSDEAFRRAAPPLGSVQLSTAASSDIRKMLDTIRRQIGNRCIVATIGWMMETRSKGPNDAEWKVTGPGLSAGTFSCNQVPPDVVRTIDGIRIVFSGDDASRFTGKIVHREDGAFIVKDR